MTVQLKATEQYFPVVFFIMLYKVVLTFECVDEILKFDHSYGVQFIKSEREKMWSLCYLYSVSDLLDPRKTVEDIHSGNYLLCSYRCDCRNHFERHIHLRLQYKRKIQLND